MRLLNIELLFGKKNVYPSDNIVGWKIQHDCAKKHEHVKGPTPPLKPGPNNNKAKIVTIRWLMIFLSKASYFVVGKDGKPLWGLGQVQFSVLPAIS